MEDLKKEALMTAVYLAARFDQRARLTEEVAKPLVAAGHTVTSNWLELPPEAPGLGQQELAGQEHLGVEQGRACYRDVRRADALAVFTEHPSSTGGYHVETGLAIAWGKTVHVVGPVPNIFYTLSGIMVYPNVEQFLKMWGCPPE